MGIFYALDTTLNAAFQYDLRRTFQNLNPEDPKTKSIVFV
jgi:hypothetical protein